MQTATQSNANKAEATFGGSQAGIVAVASGEDDENDAEGGVSQFNDFGVALQGQLVGQVNLSGQGGLSVVTAISKGVTVSSGSDPAGGDGLKAVSSAEAVAPVVQTATQSNSNSASSTFDGSQANLELTASDDAAAEVDLFEGGNIALQGQIVGQVNLSAQGGASVATALSGPVDLTQSGQLDAGKNGLVAKSSAKATAPVVQTATQSNENTAAATFSGSQIDIGTQAGDSPSIDITVTHGEPNLALQGQLVGQVNLNGQFGASVATAVSDEVNVNQIGIISAGDDGINAASTAESVAAVIQSGGQSNSNSAESTFNAGLLVIDGEQEPLGAENIGLQGQLAGQFNVSLQAGAAISTAISDEVTVTSKTDPAGDDGIDASSSAQSVAAVVQTLGTETKEGYEPGQSNVNTAAINLPGEDEPCCVSGAQLQGMLQANLSLQGGLAIATSFADEVKVDQSGKLLAGDDGIVASSAATAVALVDQSAYQSNENTLEDSDQRVRQGQLVGQFNISAQSGAAIALAFSDDVTVKQNGYVKVGGDGINASSTAGASAAVKQYADQSNQNNDGRGLAAQENLSFQDGLAIALAASGDVKVEQNGILTAGGTGIKAISLAQANAEVNQEAEQYNGVPANELGNSSEHEASTAAIAVANKSSIKMSGRVTAGSDGVVGASVAEAHALGGNHPIDMQQAYAAYEGEEWQGAQAFLLQPPSSFALALADDVDIATNGSIIAKGNGIVAISKAVAEAQSDDLNSAAVAISRNVKVTVSGDVTAGKNGILAGSVADASADGLVGFEQQGNVTVTVKRGDVTGGSGYYGIAILGGAQNTITIGHNASVTSLSRLAIYGEEGDETVHNYGLVDGDVDLNGGANAFNNYASGSFYSANVIDLNGGLLSNAGRLSPGGPGFIQTSELNGSLVQTNSGDYEVDVELKKPSADFIHATGSAALGGEVDPTIIANPASGSHKVTILTADNGVTNNGLSVGDTALVDYSLRFPNPNDVVLEVDVDFAPKGLKKDASAVGSFLNKVFKNGGSNKLDSLGLALLELPSVGAVSNAYNQLSGENYRALGVAELYSQEQFSEDQMSCPVRDGGAWAFIDENQCVYARVRYRNLQQDANAGTSSSDEDAIGVMGGAQFAWNGPWHAGVAVGYENSDLSSNDPRVSSDGDRFRVGGSVKYIAGPWFVGGALTGNWSNYDSTRRITFAGFESVTRSDQDFSNFGGQVRFAYQLNANSSWYAKPMVDLMVTNVDMDGFAERGGLGAELKVAGYDETVFSATPALEVGNQWATSGGTLVRPYVRGGVSFYNDANFPIAAGFGAAPGVTPFTTTGEIDNVLGNVSAGVKILGIAGSVLSFSYDGSFGDTIVEHSASAKASVRF